MTGVGLALLEAFQQRLQLIDGGTCLALRFLLAGSRCGFQLATRIMQLVLGLAALLLQLGQQLLGIRLGCTAGILQVFQQAVGKLLQQMQGGGYRLFLR